MSRRAVLVGALLLSAALLSPGAGAHADLAPNGSDPAPNSEHNPTGRTVVTLAFTESVVTDRYTTADVTDINGTSMKAGPITFEPNHQVMHVPVRPLTDGVYTVTWQTLSTDTHTLHGGYFFSVGAASLKFGGTFTVQNSQGSDLAEGVAKWVYYCGLFLALGAPVFLLVVDRRATMPGRALAVAGAGAVVAGAASATSLYFLASRTQLDLVDAALSDAGQYIAARAALVAAAGIALLLGALLRRARVVLLPLALVLAALATLTTSLASHAASDPDYPQLSIPIDALHLTMGGLWIGGLVTFGLTSGGRTSADVGRVVRRFTPLALTSVFLILATGTWASLRHIPTVPDLWQTTYGQLVLAKIALLGVLIVFGYVNKSIVGPRLARNATSPRTFRRILAGEATTMALVLLVAGVLASSSPPTASGVGPTFLSPYLELENQTTEYHIVVEISPNPVTVGPHQVIVQLHPFNTPLPSSTDVQLDWQAPGESGPTGTFKSPASTGPNEWTLNNVPFTSAGDWKLHVYVQTSTYTHFVFDVPVKAAGAAP